MGGTFYEIGIGLTVDRGENLPDGMDPDAVCAEVRRVVEAALDAWYDERGHELLRTEPIVG